MENVDLALEQMVGVCVRRGIAPFGDLYRYGEAVYRLADTPEDRVWVGDFDPWHREWLVLARGERAQRAE